MQNNEDLILKYETWVSEWEKDNEEMSQKINDNNHNINKYKQYIEELKEN